MNATILVLMLLPCLPAANDAAESVDAGAEALNPGWPAAYPWYDPKTDGVRRIELRQPRPPAPPTRRGPGWSGPSVFMQRLFWIVLLLVLAILIFILIWTFFKNAKTQPISTLAASSPRDDDDFHRVEALPFPVRSGRHDLFDEARERYLQGDYGQAIIYLFSYQLIQLDRNQVIRLTKGKTNRQYLREVGRRKTLRGLLERTMVAFEDVFFGNHSLDQDQFEAIWSRMGEFQALATEGAV